MIRYVITGASGWLGLALVDSLLNGSSDYELEQQLQSTESIRAFIPAGSEIPDQFKNKRIDWVFGDVRDKLSLSNLFDGCRGATLFHLAGCIHPSIFSKNFVDVNFKGTINVIEAAKLAGISKAIVMSSNSPLGCNPYTEHLFTEESPYNPYMGYGHSKFLMESYLLNQMNESSCFPITIIRAPWFYGERQPQRQKLFFKMIEANKFPLIGSGNNRRSMVYVGNLVMGLILASKSYKAENEIFWISDERPYSMKEIITTVSKLIAKIRGIECTGFGIQLPSIVSDCAYALDGLIQGIGLYNSKIHVLSEMNKTIVGSNQKAIEKLNYKPVVTLEKGMERSLIEMYA